MYAASRREGICRDGDPSNYAYQKEEEMVILKQSSVGHKSGNVLCIQAQTFDSCHSNKMLEAVAFVKGSEDGISSLSQSTPRDVSNLNEEIEAVSTSEKERKECFNPNSESDVRISK